MAKGKAGKKGKKAADTPEQEVGSFLTLSGIRGTHPYRRCNENRSEP